MPRKAARLLGSCGNASPRIATPALPAARGHGKVLASGALALTVLAGLVRLSPAEPPIRIGASLARTGQYAALGRQGSRGYELCAKHTNDTGGLLGRRVDLLVEDDQSQPTVAVGIYEQLITREKVDAILGPYSSRITDPVADVSEKYRMPMIAPMAATAAIFEKGRGYVFMTNRPAESYLAGLIDMAADMGLRTVALVNEDTLFPKAIARGASELARARGLRVVLAEEFSRGTRDFSPILSRVRDADADVLAVATYFEDTVAITRRLRELAVNPRTYGVVHGVAYAGCQILVEAIKRAGSLDGEKIRAEILKPDLNTVYGRFKVDQDGFQIAKRALMFQWQEGKKAIVWPYELAPSKPRFPTPPWSQR